MSQWRPERAAIGVDGDGISVCLPSDEGVHRYAFERPHAGVADPAAGFRAALAQALEAHPLLARRGARGHVTLSTDSLARYWMMAPPAGVGTVGELRAVAAARCRQLFGDDTAWRTAGDWDARRPFLCVALPSWLVEAAGSMLGRQAHVVAALPLLLGRRPVLTARQGWLCVLLPGRTALVRHQGGRMAALRAFPAQTALGARARLLHALGELRRENLRLGLALDPLVHWWGAGLITAAGAAETALDVEGVRFEHLPLLAPAGSADGMSSADVAAWIASAASAH